MKLKNFACSSDWRDINIWTLSVGQQYIRQLCLSEFSSVDMEVRTKWAKLMCFIFKHLIIKLSYIVRPFMAIVLFLLIYVLNVNSIKSLCVHKPEANNASWGTAWAMSYHYLQSLTGQYCLLVKFCNGQILFFFANHPKVTETSIITFLVILTLYSPNT